MIRWLALLLFLPVAAAAQSPQAEPAPSIEGRADAPVSVVTYLSFTCPHCATREAEVSAPLHQLITAGIVREETRHALRDPLDLIAATLARCQGPAAYPRNGLDLVATRLSECVPDQAFFPVTESLFADQQSWAFDNEAAINAALTSSDDISQSAPAIAGAAGLTNRFAQRGLSADAQRQCLGDRAAFDTLAQRRDAATSEFDITGTPTFVLNGQTFQIETDPTQGSMWEQVERAVTRAGGRKA